MLVELTAVFQQVPEGFLAFVEELLGANAQGATLDEARSNLQEAVTLVLEANRALSEQALANASVIRERSHLSASSAPTSFVSASATAVSSFAKAARTRCT